MTTTSEVTEVVSAFADTWNRHDMDSFAALFAEDAEFVNVVGLWWKGRAQIKEAHEVTHSSMFRESRLTLLSTDVRFPLRELAIARSRWTLEGHTDPAGDPLPMRTGILVNLLLSTGTGWSIVDSQNTDIIEDVLTRPQ
jgi:uncharacterized protein (TIGR02246 family)